MLNSYATLTGCCAELAEVPLDEFTRLFYVMQYDNLTIVIRDLLRVLGVDPDEPWPER